MGVICYLCGKPIIGKYYFDWAGHASCFEHINEQSWCVSCGRICDSKAVHIGMGGKICTYCQQHYVNEKDCKHIVPFINKIYANSPLGEVHNWKLKVINAMALQKRTGSLYTRGYAQLYDGEYTIYVYRQLSKVQFANVLAHEVLHVWQWNHNLRPIQMLCEGFCNLGSYIVLTHIDTDESRAARERLMNNTDPIYGEGFRFCKTLYDEGGWTRVIKELAKHQY